MTSLLSPQELSFLESQGLSPADVFDGRSEASGINRGKLAKNAGKLIVLRDPSRSKCGHRLTTRAGHCIQCDTERLAHAMRNEKPAFVYIAGSRNLAAIKLGWTQNVSQRLQNLNGQAYASARDWEMLFHVKFLRAGAVETLAQSYLNPSGEILTTFKEGREQEAKEIFDCSFDDACQALVKAATHLGLQPSNQAWRSAKAKSY